MFPFFLGGGGGGSVGLYFISITHLHLCFCYCKDWKHYLPGAITKRDRKLTFEMFICGGRQSVRVREVGEGEGGGIAMEAVKCFF